MSKLSILLLLIAFRIYYHPTPNSAPAGFVPPATITTATPPKGDARVISSSANSMNNKIWLNWALSENEIAYALRVEKNKKGNHAKL